MNTYADLLTPFTDEAHHAPKGAIQGESSSGTAHGETAPVLSPEEAKPPMPLQTFMGETALIAPRPT
jgi:hypothetical protein